TATRDMVSPDTRNIDGQSTPSAGSARTGLASRITYASVAMSLVQRPSSVRG
ncbi:hypothetical protein M413DRAFT_448113, partial [Hebeloma cylindrosporum]